MRAREREREKGFRILKDAKRAFAIINFFFFPPKYPWLSLEAGGVPIARSGAQIKNNWRLKLWRVWTFQFCYIWIKGHLRLRGKKGKNFSHRCEFVLWRHV